MIICLNCFNGGYITELLQLINCIVNDSVYMAMNIH